MEAWLGVGEATMEECGPIGADLPRLVEQGPILEVGAAHTVTVTQFTQLTHSRSTHSHTVTQSHSYCLQSHSTPACRSHSPQVSTQTLLGVLGTETQTLLGVLGTGTQTLLGVWESWERGPRLGWESWERGWSHNHSTYCSNVIFTAVTSTFQHAM